MTTINFTIPGTPIPLERARHGKGRTFDTARNRNAKAAVAWECKSAMANQKPIEGPVRLSIAFLYEWPKSYSKKRRQSVYGNLKDTAPDLSNLIKLVEDGLNGVSWKDDSQVAEYGHVCKMFTVGKPETRVTIEPLWGQGG